MKRLILLGLIMTNFLGAEEFTVEITERQGKCIETIFYSLAEKSAAGLMFNALQLRSMGKEIDPIPPLQFLGYIVSKPEIIAHMKKTEGKYFQWNAFISGFGDKCNKKTVYNQIRDDLAAFAEMTGFTVVELIPFVDTKDWQGLVKYIIQRRGE